MFRLLLLSPDNASIQEFTGDAAKEVLRNPNRSGQLWLDITNQKQADIDLLSQVFRFHPLALEDCLHFDQRAKLEEYPAASRISSSSRTTLSPCRACADLHRASRRRARSTCRATCWLRGRQSARHAGAGDARLPRSGDARHHPRRAELHGRSTACFIACAWSRSSWRGAPTLSTTSSRMCCATATFQCWSSCRICSTSSRARSCATRRLTIRKYLLAAQDLGAHAPRHRRSATSWGSVPTRRQHLHQRAHRAVLSRHLRSPDARL